MKRILFLLLLSLLAFGLSACAEQAEGEESGETYRIYYLTTATGEGSALAYEERTLPEAGEDPVQALLTLVLSSPQSEGLARAIPENVTLRAWSLEGGTLTADFSGGYTVLSGVELTLADYCVVLTMTQLEEVETVIITTNGREIAYRDHQSLTADDILLSLTETDLEEGEDIPETEQTGEPEEAQAASE